MGIPRNNSKRQTAKEGPMLNGVKEIARRAKVSLATVDRVIHNRTGVSEKTKSRVSKIIAELNYQPNIFARQLASRKNIEFAVFLPVVSIETTYWKAPLDGVLQAEKELNPLGITVTKYFFNQDDVVSFKRQAQCILKHKPAGIVMAPVFIPESIAFLSSCRTLNIPYVFIDADIPNQERLSYIGPDLFQSGCLAGHLLSYGVRERARILVLNISRDLNALTTNESKHRLFRKEEGIRSYFSENRPGQELVTLNIPKSDYNSISTALKKVMAQFPDIQAICVTNSRVSSVAQWLESTQQQSVFLVGFDFTDNNINYLKKGIIDFVICDKPQEQGYRGTMALYQKLVLGLDVDLVYYMPIDIITKENCAFYRN